MKRKLQFCKYLIIFLLTSGKLFSQTFTERISQSKKFEAKHSQTLQITNKYGNIAVNQWNKDSILINVEIKIEAAKKEKFEWLKKHVEITFSQNGYFIIAETHLETSNSIFSEIFSLTEEIYGQKSEIKIDYNISAPSYIHLKINNKYGDVFIGNLQGNLFLQLSNGNLKAENLEAESNLEINFGNRCAIRYAKNATINISYSELTILKAEKLTITSKSTKISVNEANIFTIHSKRDNISILNVKNLYGDAYFSGFSVKNIEKEIELNLKYGEMTVENISQHFSSLRWTSKFTDINIYTKKNLSYKLNVTSKNASVEYPKEFIKSQEIDNHDDTKSIIGSTSGEPSSEIKIQAEGGKINIFAK